MRLQHLALVSLLAVTPGCFLSKGTTNRPLQLEQIATLEPGVTTAREAVERLGGPAEVVQLGKRSAYRYEHREERVAGLFLLVLGLRGVDTTEDRTWLFFDEQEVLTHVGTTLEAGQVRYTVPLFKE